MEQRYSQSFESIRAGEPAGDLLRKAARGGADAPASSLGSGWN